MKKAVIFDLDGLLIDSEVISHRLYDELLHRYGKSVTVAEYEDLFGLLLRSSDLGHIPQTLDLSLIHI